MNIANTVFLHALAREFGGSPPFTTHEVADRGLDDNLGVRSIGNALRAAVGRPVAYGDRTIELQPAGFAHRHRRRWRFVVLTPPMALQTLEADPDADLL